MPAPGDQHKHSNTETTNNPFTEKLGDYAAQDIATLQNRLSKQLGPEFISKRQGPGGQSLHYISSEKVINLANEIFGFNGWSSSIQNVQVDFLDQDEKNGSICLGLSVILRVTLKDGTYHEDVGYGQIVNAKNKGMAFEKAKKEGVTDALKRCLRTFGNVLGNCLYDKDYIKNVSKMKAVPAKWDSDNLHRHADFAPVKREGIPTQHNLPERAATVAQEEASIAVAEHDDEFGADLFEGVDFSESTMDDMMLEDSAIDVSHDVATMKPELNHARQGRQSIPRVQSMPALRQPNPGQPGQPPIQPQPPQVRPQITQQGPTTPGPLRPRISQAPNAIQQGAARMQQANHHQQPPKPSSTPDSGFQKPAMSSESPVQPPATVSFEAPSGAIPANPPILFTTSRHAELLQNLDQPAEIKSFDPHVESPSIRKTSGVDHKMSAPIRRTVIANSIKAADSTASIPASVAPVPPQSYKPGAGGSFERPSVTGPPPGRPSIAAAAALNNAAPPQSRNFINPQADMNRRIGVPGGGVQSPRTSAYKLPMKRMAEQQGAPLADISNLKANGADEGSAAAGDQKRTKVGS